MRTFAAFVVASFVTVGASPAAAAGAGGTSVVVVPLAGSADAATREAVADDLRKEVGALGYAVQQKKVTAQHLVTAAAIGLTCDTAKPDCMVKLGALAGGALVVGGVVDGTNLALRVLDVGSARERSSESVDIGGAKGRASAMRLIAVRLLAPERERGTIEVVVKQKGATVMIDGKPIGQTPLKGAVDVVPGKHEVYVALGGFESHIESFDVDFENKAHLDVDLKPGAGGPPPPELTLGAAPAAAPAPVAQGPTVVDDKTKKKFTRIAVYTLEANAVEPRVARIVTDAILQELRKREGASVVGTEEIKAMLDHEANRQLVGCESNTSCLAEIAGALGADVVVIGSVAHIGSESVFGLRRLDQKTAQVTAQETVRLVPADGEEFVAAVGGVVKKLFDKDFPLRPGEKIGAPAELALRVHPPPLPTWAFWSTTAGAGVVAAAALGAGAANLAALQTYNAQLEPKSGGPADGAALKQTENLIFTSALGFYGGLGASVLIGGAAGLEALFTDWNGYGDDSSGAAE